MTDKLANLLTSLGGDSKDLSALSEVLGESKSKSTEVPAVTTPTVDTSTSGEKEVVWMEGESVEDQKSKKQRKLEELEKKRKVMKEKIAAKKKVLEERKQAKMKEIERKKQIILQRKEAHEKKLREMEARRKEIMEKKKAKLAEIERKRKFIDGKGGGSSSSVVSEEQKELMRAEAAEKKRKEGKEKKAEADRIMREKIEEQKRINAVRMKADAERRKKLELEKEAERKKKEEEDRKRKEAERLKREEEERKRKAAEMKKREEERKEAERKRKEEEARKKKEAERKRKEAERKKKEEEEEKKRIAERNQKKMELEKERSTLIRKKNSCVEKVNAVKRKLALIPKNRKKREEEEAKRKEEEDLLLSAPAATKEERRLKIERKLAKRANDKKWKKAEAAKQAEEDEEAEVSKMEISLLRKEIKKMEDGIAEVSRKKSALMKKIIVKKVVKRVVKKAVKKSPSKKTVVKKGAKKKKQVEGSAYFSSLKEQYTKPKTPDDVIKKRDKQFGNIRNRFTKARAQSFVQNTKPKRRVRTNSPVLDKSVMEERKKRLSAMFGGGNPHGMSTMSLPVKIKKGTLKKKGPVTKKDDKGQKGKKKDKKDKKKSGGLFGFGRKSGKDDKRSSKTPKSFEKKGGGRKSFEKGRQSPKKNPSSFDKKKGGGSKTPAKALNKKPSALDKLRKVRELAMLEREKQYLKVSRQDLGNVRATLVKEFMTGKNKSWRIDPFKREISKRKKGVVKDSISVNEIAKMKYVSSDKDENRKLVITLRDEKGTEVPITFKNQLELNEFRQYALFTRSICYSDILSKFAKGKSQKKHKGKKYYKIKLSAGKSANDIGCYLDIAEESHVDVDLLCCTWYMRGFEPLSPDKNSDLNILQTKFIKKGKDMYVFCIQHIPQGFVGAHYFSKILGGEYSCVISKSFMDNAIFVFAREECAGHFLNVELATKLLKCKHKKKAVVDNKPKANMAVGFEYLESKFLFFNIHLFEESYSDDSFSLNIKNQHLNDVLSTLSFDKKSNLDICCGYDYVYVLGNFNYRSSSQDMKDKVQVISNDTMKKKDVLCTWKELELKNIEPRKVNVRVTMIPDRILYKSYSDVNFGLLFEKKESYYSANAINTSPDLPIIYEGTLEVATPFVSFIRNKGDLREYSLVINFIELTECKNTGGYLQFFSRNASVDYVTTVIKKFDDSEMRLWAKDDIPVIKFSCCSEEYLKNQKVAVAFFTPKGVFQGWCFIFLSKLVKAGLGAPDTFQLDMEVNGKVQAVIKGEYFLDRIEIVEEKDLIDF